MSIASEITRINNNIASAYTACNNKGATMPQTQNSSNLATTISSISSGRDWSEIGYTEEPAFIQTGIDYAKQIQQNWVTSTDYSYKFERDYFLKFMPLVDTSSGENFEWMFFDCESLTSLAGLDTSSGENFEHMFDCCPSLTTIPQLNTSRGESFESMFEWCSTLSIIPELDVPMGTNFYDMFYNCDALTTMGGLKNAGQAFDTSAVSNYSCYVIDLSGASNLTEQSLINVLTDLYDIATKGCNTQKCTIGATNLAKLTSQAGQAALTQAQNYGWTIS